MLWRVACPNRAMSDTNRVDGGTCASDTLRAMVAYRIPVVAFTASRENVSDVSLHCVLRKPVLGAELAETVRSYLASRPRDPRR